ncbi:MAG: flagellin, partial [Planctomycetes bacterium]|nr:flagellin [Planctomycetota bacterium]
AIDNVTTTRGALGAAQNRLTSAISSILNTRENLSAAESRIRDVDVAIETADLTRNSILQQAAVSVLAQANTQPQLALSLLQG